MIFDDFGAHILTFVLILWSLLILLMVINYFDDY